MVKPYVDRSQEFESGPMGVDRLPVRAMLGIQPKEVSATDRQVGGSHYKDMGIQPLDFIYANGLGFCEGNAIKYICRHRVKGGVQDIHKAIHYLELLLEKEYSNDESSSHRQQVG